MRTDQEYSVEAFSCTIGELFNEKLYSGKQRYLAHSIEIDSYQRDYVWSKAKVDQLIKDICSHQENIHYYLGSLLFHEKIEVQPKLYIIDGQQRLTTLAILYHISTNTIPNHFHLRFASAASQKNIRDINDAISESEARSVTDRLDEIDVTVIITGSQDQAFRFFDSQNTRGVRLSTTDLLKSYHLRTINDNTDLQEDAAKRWENLQARKRVLVKDPKKDPAFELFERSLWRIRNWTRGHFEYEQWDTVLNEFEDNRDGSEQAAIFPGPQNQNFKAIQFKGNSEFTLTRTPFQPGSNAKNLPLLIQQPLYDGYFFFLYAEKYSELLEELQNTSRDDDLLRSFITAESGVSYYLKELLVNLALAYIDRFNKDDQYYHFLKLVMLWFLQARLQRQLFRKRSPFRMLRDNINVFGLIEGAYDSRDMMERFQQKLVNQAEDKVEGFEGIRNRYVREVNDLLPEGLKWDEIKGEKWKKVYKNFTEN